MNAFEIAVRRAQRARSAQAERRFLAASIACHVLAIGGTLAACLAWYLSDPIF